MKKISQKKQKIRHTQNKNYKAEFYRVDGAPTSAFAREYYAHIKSKDIVGEEVNGFIPDY